MKTFLTNIFSSQQHQAQHSLLLPLHSLGRLGLQLPELLAVAQDHVHVLVERLELSNEGSAVLEDDSHPVVDVVLHLVVSSNNHFVYF